MTNLTLPGFHGSTECDTVSTFYFSKRGEKAWDSWVSYTAAKRAFCSETGGHDVHNGSVDDCIKCWNELLSCCMTVETL